MPNCAGVLALILTHTAPVPAAPLYCGFWLTSLGSGFAALLPSLKGLGRRPGGFCANGCLVICTQSRFCGIALVWWAVLAQTPGSRLLSALRLSPRLPRLCVSRALVCLIGRQPSCPFLRQGFKRCVGATRSARAFSVERAVPEVRGTSCCRILGFAA